MKKEDLSFLEGLNRQFPAAYHELYNQYYKVLTMYAHGFTLPIDAAKDIVQNLFISIWERNPNFSSQASLRSYLYNSTRNAAFNYLKRLNIESEYLEKLADTYQEVTDEETTDEEVYHLLFQTIEKLPPRCRKIFLLYMDGKKNEEIATQLGVSLETVKTQKKRAMQYIRKQMGTLYFILSLSDLLNNSQLFS